MVTKTTAVGRIRRLAGNIGTALEVCASAKKKSVLLKTLQPISAEISESVAFLAQHQKRKFVEVRKNLTAVCNIVNGLIEGLSNDDLDRRAFIKQVNNLTTHFFPKVHTSLSNEVERLQSLGDAEPELTEQQQKAKLSIALSGTMKEQLGQAKLAFRAAREKARQEKQDAEDAANTANTPLKDDDLTSQLAKAAQSYENLPITIRGKFQRVFMPVVPIFTDANKNRAETFDRIKLPHIMIEGYGILTKQNILCIAHDTAQEYSLSPLAYAQTALSYMNERSGETFELVSETACINPRNSAISLFWLMRKTDMDRMMRVVGSGKNSTLTWGFPFSL